MPDKTPLAFIHPCGYTSPADVPMPVRNDGQANRPGRTGSCEGMMVRGLDLRTVTTVFALISVFRIGVTILLWRRARRHYAGLGFLVIEACTYATAQILFILRGILPDFLTYAVANVLIVSSGVFIRESLCRYTGEKMSRLPDFAAVAAHFSIYLVFMYLESSLQMRTAIFILFSMFLLGRSVYLVLGKIGQETKRTLTATLIALFVLESIFLFRLLHLATFTMSGDYFMQSNVVDSIFLVLLHLMALGMTFSYFISVNSRLDLDIKAAFDEKLNLLSRLEKLAMEDSLTNTFRRHTIDELIYREILASEKERTTFCLILVDVDHFKWINDRYGHLEGDRVLKLISAALKSSLRDQDRIGRWGGDEFIVLLPHTGLSEGIRIAEAMREHVENLQLLPREPVTASFGASAWIHGEEANATLRRADEALYRAKSGGRNRVES